MNGFEQHTYNCLIKPAVHNEYADKILELLKAFPEDEKIEILNKTTKKLRGY
jgi:hypothetical protein